MKLKVTSVVLNYYGKPVQDKATWRDVIYAALNSDIQGEELTKEQKEKFFNLTKDAFEHELVEWSLDDRAVVLERISKVYGPLVYGRAKEFLEGDGNTK